ncbi:SDR family oxidoreductase [Candidatus Uabimicrobium sp. HlEnr_7]|uniref:SDR family oxidoreductase n=1 Tax=Candidatus Uabimicrobium helgolandensis TaxID=3095367 RepID=UPI0035576E55
MMKRKVVLITGCSSGLGYETALWLAEKGYIVYASMRNLKKNKRLVEESKQRNLNIHICELDVCNIDTIDNCVSGIIENEKRIDILINNAGFAVLGKFTESTNEDFERQFATNFYGALNCSRAVLPYMIDNKEGTIINVSSILGLTGAGTLSAYCSSKFALEGWSESIRCELKKKGINIVLVEPGFFRTEIYNNVSYVSENKKQYSISSMGGSPIRVAKRIESILKKKRPRRRYTIGYDSYFGCMIKRFFPDFISEKLVK